MLITVFLIFGLFLLAMFMAIYEPKGFHKRAKYIQLTKLEPFMATRNIQKANHTWEEL